MPAPIVHPLIAEEFARLGAAYRQAENARLAITKGLCVSAPLEECQASELRYQAAAIALHIRVEMALITYGALLEMQEEELARDRAERARAKAKLPDLRVVL
jgi:hypothetical protein